MKSHLLKITYLIILSYGLTLTACSESNNDNDNEIADEETPTASNENPDDSTEALTDICMFCPAYSIEQTTASNPMAVTISEPDGTICKGEDGKAYIDGVLNENNLSYEDYLQIRQMILRCSDL